MGREGDVGSTVDTSAPCFPFSGMNASCLSPDTSSYERHTFPLSFLQAGVRAPQAGLGSVASSKADPNVDYKTAVKRTLFNRFQNLD